MRISRRKFLQVLGATGALAGGFSRIWAIPDEWEETLRSGPRLETWTVSTCRQCPAGCGIRVRLIDGMPVRILGNPIAPVNRGFVCPMGEAGLELLYHPDRIGQPMRRKGKRGEPGWEPVSWEDAIREVSGALRDLRKERRAGRFAFLMGDRNTLLTEFVGEFVARLGSPHLFPWRTPAINETGFWQGTGEAHSLCFDLERTDYLITFGANLLEEPPSPVYFNRIYGKLKEGRERSGLKMVHVDPRMSQAGINATEWVRIRPGTLGVLALGMAYVILRDRIQDQAFMDRHTLDFRKDESGFSGLVQSDYYPERVSEATGVPAETILRLAREFGAAKAPLALAGGGSSSGEAEAFTQWAVMSLNAISGGLSRKRLWRDPVIPPWGPSPVPAFDPRSSSFSRKAGNALDAAVPASWITERLPDLTASGKIPDPEMLMIAQVDPVHRAADSKGWREFLSRIPRVVQFATLPDDTSPYADLVFPLPTFLEEWDVSLPVPNIPFPQIGLIQPVVPPRTGVRPFGDVLTDLAGQAGVPGSGAAEDSYRKAVLDRMTKVFSSGKGTPYFEAVSLEFLEDLRKRGWQVYSYPAFPDFWRLLKEKGGWWDPGESPDVDWKKRRPFRLPTAPRLATLLEGSTARPAGENKEGGDRPPHLLLEETIRRPDGPDSFLLFPFVTLMNMTGDGASQPILQEMFGLHSRFYWMTWAEMHPSRAGRLGLRDGDLIRIVSGTRSATVPVRIVPTVWTEILSVPFGQGHEQSGRYASNIGANPVALLDPRVDPLSGRASWTPTLVRVEKVNK